MQNYFKHNFIEITEAEKKCIEYKPKDYDEQHQENEQEKREERRAADPLQREKDEEYLIGGKQYFEQSVSLEIEREIFRRIESK